MGLSFNGSWSATVTYWVDDVVTFAGSSYISLVKQNVGQQPDLSPAAWAVLAAAGLMGPQGIEGPVGPEGPQGVPGPAGLVEFFQTINPSISLPAGNFLISLFARVRLTAAQAISGETAARVSFSLAVEGQGSFLAGDFSAFIPSGSLESDVLVPVFGSVTLLSPANVQLSLSASPLTGVSVSLTVLSRQLQAVRVSVVQEQ